MGIFGAVERHFDTWSRQYVEMRVEALNADDS
jgi:hypothetical protein